MELLSDWLPVLVDVLLLSDWSPVDVLLSIVRLERPRRSMLGLNVEVEPVTEFRVSVEDPVTAEFELEVEPVTDGLVLVPAVVDDGDDDVEPLKLPEDVVPPVLPLLAVLPVVPVPPDVEAWLSGMQSMWTGLFECSFALPVDLSASLPAFGWPRLLQSGFVASAVVVVPVVLPDAFPLRLPALLVVLPIEEPVDGDVERVVGDVERVVDELVEGDALVDGELRSERLELLLEVCASAGVAPITAAAMRLRVKGIRFI